MNDKLATIVVDADPHYRLAIRQQLAKMADAELVGEAENISAGLELLKKTQADLVILELPNKPDHSLAAAEKWRTEFPHIMLYASSASKNPELILAAMRAGLSEYLSKPLEVQEFRRAIEKAIRMRKTEAQRDGSTGAVIGVFSKKGGLGVSTIAVNLAVALGSSEEAHTAIVDMGFDLGDVPSLLDLNPEYTFADVLGKNGDVDPGKLQSCLTRHSSEIYFFGERENANEAGSITPAQVCQMLGHLRESFQNVVLDLPHSFDTHTYEAFEIADTILLVATADLSTIRATKYALKVFRTLGYDDNKVKIILNRVSKRDPISVAQFEDTVQQAVTWAIPNDYARVIESLNAGEPFVVANRKSPISKSLIQLAEQFQNSNDNHGSENATTKRSIVRFPFGRQRGR